MNSLSSLSTGSATPSPSPVEAWANCPAAGVPGPLMNMGRESAGALEGDGSALEDDGELMC